VPHVPVYQLRLVKAPDDGLQLIQLDGLVPGAVFFVPSTSPSDLFEERLPLDLWILDDLELVLPPFENAFP